jgi:hypothetical protein
MADARDVPESGLTAGENGTMPTRISSPNAAITEPCVFPSLRTKVPGLSSEPDANADVTVPLTHCAFS